MSMLRALPTEKPRGRRSGNPVRFPHVLNVAVSTEINDALERARLSFGALSYTPSDVTRLALFEWLKSKGYMDGFHSG